MKDNLRPVDRFKLIWQSFKIGYFYEHDKKQWVEEMARKMHASMNGKAELKKLIEEENDKK